MRELCRLQDEFEVSYARIVVVSVDPPEVQAAFRSGLGARFTFLPMPSEVGFRGSACSRERTRSTTHTVRPGSRSTQI